MKEKQIPLNFDEKPEEPLKMQELHEKDECSACGNIIESDSPGCFQCRHDLRKEAYQKVHGKKPPRRDIF